MTPKTWEDIPGWFDWPLLYDKIPYLYAGGTLVEVGTYLGRSLCHLGTRVRESGKPFKVVGVDWCVGSGVENGKCHHEEAVQEGGGTFAGTLHRNVIDCGLQDVITVVIGDSARVAELFEDDSLTMVFLDGRHDYGSVRNDILAWKPKVAPGGILAGDDMGVPDEADPVWPGVGQAVRELLTGWQYYPHDSWVWIKPR